MHQNSVFFFTQNGSYYRAGDNPRKSKLHFPLNLHAGGPKIQWKTLRKAFTYIYLGQIYSWMLCGPPGFTIIGTHILLKFKWQRFIFLFFIIALTVLFQGSYRRKLHAKIPIGPWDIAIWIWAVWTFFPNSSWILIRLLWRHSGHLNFKK